MTSSTSPFVLIPGYWLGEWAWQTVQVRLEQLGHPTNALTLPGLESTAARRDGVTFADHVNCVAAAVGALPAPVVLVAHSGAGAVTTAVADRMPASLARVVYVDSGPVPDGHVPRPDVSADQIELPVPGVRRPRRGRCEHRRLVGRRPAAVPRAGGSASGRGCARAGAACTTTGGIWSPRRSCAVRSRVSRSARW